MMELNGKSRRKNIRKSTMKKNKDSNVLRVKDVSNSLQSTPQISLNLQASPLGLLPVSKGVKKVIQDL